MSESQKRDRTRELGELFVDVTGDDTVTEQQEEGASKEPVDGDETFEGIDDGLEGAVDADLDAQA
ncbi:hypothetical protein BRC92_13480 [Halobacteriales archaeon QS_4_69_31]|nr:MAG: hypothetical protein BRC92_13480 [Halobacteriales archaeon QS_4_69_31]